MDVRRVGCIGLGNMGAHLAEHVIAAGFDVGVFDIRPSVLEHFRALGADVDRSPAALASEVDVLTVTVVDDAQVVDVLVGSYGVLERLRPGAVVVNHSTVSPATCERLAGAAAAHSVAVVDAPLSGGQAAARDGTLTLMVGGTAEAVDACAPVLDAVSARRFHVGGVGAGQVAKLVNNIMGLVNRIVAAEALGLARAAGLDEDALIELVRSSTGNSWQIERWREVQALAAGSTTGPAGMARMAEKDLQLALSAAAALQVPLPLTEAALTHTERMFTEQG
jgi:3-hydroxyisobutyrate dehydrogenase-like beta-hydroxyacid dehydrogenase